MSGGYQMKNITFAEFSYATKKQAFVLLAKATSGKLTIKLIRKKKYLSSLLCPIMGNKNQNQETTSRRLKQKICLYTCSNPLKSYQVIGCFLKSIFLLYQING